MYAIELNLLSTTGRNWVRKAERFATFTEALTYAQLRAWLPNLGSFCRIVQVD